MHVCISCDSPSSCFGADRVLVYEGNPLPLPSLAPSSFFGITLCKSKNEEEEGQNESQRRRGNG